MARLREGNQNLDVGPALFSVVVLNTGYVFIEALFGFWVGSLALLADAAHNLTDVFGLLIAWGAFVVGQSQPTEQHTYGLGRATVLAALANGICLLIGVGALVGEAIWRIGTPEPVAAITVLWVAAIGIAVKSGTALLFMRDRSRDINTGGAFLHMAADAAVSAGRSCHHLHRLDNLRSDRCNPREGSDCVVGVQALQNGASPKP